ncbi:MAG: ECF-type sigma factor, partial [Verrucomicrobiales bacterium]|nr:ECF-type sigma factor [Verrucomicrobiales bacterium]
MREITQALQAVAHGDPKATDELLHLVYEQLRQLAARKMASEPPGQTLQPTALVHEAYLRLVQENNHTWQNRQHFYAVAAEVMRRILVDRA